MTDLLSFGSEYAPKAIWALFNMIDAAEPAAAMAGIVGNTAHRGGYHRSRRWLLDNGKSEDYSVEAPDDKLGNEWACCGLDIGMPLALEAKITHRFVSACVVNDPRLYALREVIGTYDGEHVCGYNRISTPGGSRSQVGFKATNYADSSHLSHMHLSILRRYADDLVAMKALGAVALGLPMIDDRLPKIIINGKEYDDITTVSAAGVNLARDTGAFSRHVWYVQTWLRKVVASTGPENGYWEPETQQAMNAFRTSLGWTGADVIGSVGLASLDILARKAGALKPVRL
jgi:hypothetical protein